MNISYKDRLILKAHTRMNRLKTDRLGMIPKSPQWYAKTRQIDFEKGFINDLREGTVLIQNSNRGNINASLYGSALEGQLS